MTNKKRIATLVLRQQELTNEKEIAETGCHMVFVTATLVPKRELNLVRGKISIAGRLTRTVERIIEIREEKLLLLFTVTVYSYSYKNHPSTM